MRFVEDFHGWWRDVGQFLPPVDAAGAADREQFRSFAQAASRDCIHDWNEAEITLTGEIERVESLRTENAALEKQIPTIGTDRILEILNSERLPSIDKVAKLKELYENKS